MSRRYFRIKRIALGLAFAAVAVPTAQAKPVSWTPPQHQPIASQISAQSPGSQLTPETRRWLAMAKATDGVASPGSQLTPETRRWLAMAKATDGVAYQPPYSPAYQAKVEALRYQAMARAYLNNPGTVSTAGTVNARHSALSSLSAPVTQTTSSNGFNWSDAGIGAAVAFGAALMLLMAVVLGRRFRSRPTGLAST